MITPIADGVSSTFAIPNTFVVNDGDEFILRQSTSEGAIAPSSTDYDSAFKEACSANYINISYVPLLTWDGTNYYVSEMLCHSTNYILTSVVQNVQIPFKTTVPCNSFIEVLKKIQ